MGGGSKGGSALFRIPLGGQKEKFPVGGQKGGSLVGAYLSTFGNSAEWDAATPNTLEELQKVRYRIRNKFTKGSLFILRFLE